MVCIRVSEGCHHVVISSTVQPIQNIGICAAFEVSNESVTPIHVAMHLMCHAIKAIAVILLRHVKFQEGRRGCKRLRM